MQRRNSYSGGHEELVSHFTSCTPSVCVISYLLQFDSTVTTLFASYPLNDAAETVNEIGSSIRRVMGGTSGIM